MKTAEIIGRNIQKQMDEHSITALELAKLIGVTRQTLANYLTGESVIDSEKLSILSKYFNKPFDYFFEKSDAKLSFMFRATNPKENIDDESLLKIEMYMKKYFELSQAFNESIIYVPEQYNLTIKFNSKTASIDDPDIDFSIFNYKIPKDLDNTIEQIAYEQRRKLGAEESTGSDIIKSLENAGIKILFKNVANENFFAMSAYSLDKGFFILVNDHPDIPEERKLFSVLHEYAHLILHRDCYSSNHEYGGYGSKKNILEATADAFAGYFLMPKYLLSKHDDILRKKPLSMNDLIYVKQDLKVSLMALIMTAYKYNYINESIKKKAFEILYKKGYGKKEPASTLQLEKNQKYEFMIKSLYLSDKLTQNDIISLLEFDSSTVEQKLRTWSSEKNDFDTLE
jgi:Zn-dependent peptidase ImmA (M78 family)/DNA-binding XRE family transcriptional regulator